MKHDARDGLRRRNGYRYRLRIPQIQVSEKDQAHSPGCNPGDEEVAPIFIDSNGGYNRGQIVTAPAGTLDPLGT